MIDLAAWDALWEPLDPVTARLYAQAEAWRKSFAFPPGPPDRMELREIGRGIGLDEAIALRALRVQNPRAQGSRRAERVLAQCEAEVALMTVYATQGPRAPVVEAAQAGEVLAFDFGTGEA